MRTRTGRLSARASCTLRAGRTATGAQGPYDWNDTAPLTRLVSGLAARGAFIAASSEGGLFEYGTDDAIIANLTALARADVPIVSGSVTSSSEVRQRLIAQTKFRLFARGLEGFAPLAERSGYTIAESSTAIMSEQVLLRPRATPILRTT
jgi:hypothetical protein